MKHTIEVKLTPAEEVTAVQLAQFRRHKKNRTSPGNPKWYRSTAIRPFVPQLSVRVPRFETGQEWHTAHGMSRDDPFAAVNSSMSVADYVRAYEKAAGLKAVVAALAPRKQRVRRAA